MSKMVSLAYCTVGSNSLNRAKAFYDTLFAITEIVPLLEHSSGGRIYAKDGKPFFGILGPYNSKAATTGNGSMVGLLFDTRDEVNLFHAKALELGGADEGGPGERSPGFYLAYFRDLDGNKFCAFSLGIEEGS